MDLINFVSQFNFQPDKSMLVGPERECHLVGADGKIKPIAPTVLDYLWSSVNGRKDCYGYELSACQFEERLEKPSKLSDARNMMLANQADITRAEIALGFKRAYYSVAPSDVPLDVFPVERYQRITRDMPFKTLHAACRVTGVHVLVGMPDKETALRVYNHVVGYYEDLCRIGHVKDGKMFWQTNKDCASPWQLDGYSVSERLWLFKESGLVERFLPPRYDSWDDFFERAKHEGFVSDPRRLWDFIRSSKHGAIEFRMFDTVEDLDIIFFWANYCLNICQEVL